MAFPDALAMLIGYLDGLHAVPVASRVPDPRPAEWIQVRQVGGAWEPPVRDVARVDLFAWSTSEPAARTLGEQVRREIHALVGTSLSGVQVYRVEESLQRQTDDPLTGSPGWWATYAITLRADDAMRY